MKVVTYIVLFMIVTLISSYFIGNSDPEPLGATATLYIFSVIGSLVAIISLLVNVSKQTINLGLFIFAALLSAVLFIFSLVLIKYYITFGIGLALGCLCIVFVNYFTFSFGKKRT